MFALNNRAIFNTRPNAKFISIQEILECADVTKTMRLQDRVNHFESVGINYSNAVKYGRIVETMNKLYFDKPLTGKFKYNMYEFVYSFHIHIVMFLRMLIRIFV